LALPLLELFHVKDNHLIAAFFVLLLGRQLISRAVNPVSGLSVNYVRKVDQGFGTLLSKVLLLCDKNDSKRLEETPSY